MVLVPVVGVCDPALSSPDVPPSGPTRVRRLLDLWRSSEVSMSRHKDNVRVEVLIFTRKIFSWSGPCPVLPRVDVKVNEPSDSELPRNSGL